MVADRRTNRARPRLNASRGRVGTVTPGAVIQRCAMERVEGRPPFRVAGGGGPKCLSRFGYAGHAGARPHWIQGVGRSDSRARSLSYRGKAPEDTGVSEGPLVTPSPRFRPAWSLRRTWSRCGPPQRELPLGGPAYGRISPALPHEAGGRARSVNPLALVIGSRGACDQSRSWPPERSALHRD